MNTTAINAVAINYSATPANLNNLSRLISTGSAIANVVPDAKFAKAVGSANALNQAVNSAMQGNYIASGMALAGLDPNSGIAQTMNKFNSASEVVTALQQGSALGAGMALAGAVPGSDFSEVMGKVAQAQDLYNQAKSIFSPQMNASDLIMHLRPPTAPLSSQSPPTQSSGQTQSLTVSGSDGAYIENGQMSLAPNKCACSKVDTKGAPVNVSYGSKILAGSEDLDHIGRGYLSFGLARVYNSQNLDIGWFGQGWVSTGFEQRLEIDEYDDRIYLIDNSGRQVPFTYINEGEHCYQSFENLTLHRSYGLNFILYMGEHNPNANTGYNGVAQHFSYRHRVTKKGTFIKATVLPSKQTDQYGHQLQLHYTQTKNKFKHLPSHITDDAGDCYQLDFINIEDNHNKPSQSPHMAKANAPPIPRLIKVSLLVDANTPHTLVEYQYNQTGDLTQVIKGSKTAREFAYTDNLMTWQRLPNGRQAHYRYDTPSNAKTARVIEHWTDSGEHYHFDYSEMEATKDTPEHLITVVTEQQGHPLERQTIYQYNDKHFVTALTDPNGNTTHYEYNQFNKLKQLTYADGSDTKYHHQDTTLNNIQTLIGYEALTNLPQYRKTDYQFDDSGNLISITNALGDKTQFDYNQHKQVRQNINANGQSSQYDYDSHGNLIRHTLANGSQFTFEYNELGQLICQTDCSSFKTQYEYDSAGRMTAVIDPEGAKTELFYNNSATSNNHSAPTRIRHPNGTLETFDYDDNNRLIKHNDAKEQHTEYEYAIDDLPIKRINATGHSLTYEYDALRRLKTLTNENGETWTFDYDKADNLISETRFDGYTSHYRYNARNQIIEQIDNPHLDSRYQRHTYFKRDVQGQLIAKHCIDYDSDASKQADKTANKTKQRRLHKSEYEYDILGRITKAVSPDASTHLEYDKLGQLIKETLYRHHSESDDAQQVLTHEYDDVGNRIVTTLPCGKHLNQLYYGSGHLYNQTLVYGEDNNTITEIRHSTTNKRHQEISRVQGQLHSRYSYDKMGRLTQSHTNLQDKADSALDPVTTPLIEKNYHYDPLGQLTTFSGSTQLSPTATMQRRHQYHYDPLGRLTEHKLTDYSKQTGVTERFAFDPASNRVPINAEPDADDTAFDKNKSATYNPQGKQTDLSQHKSEQWKRITKLTTHDKYITYEYDHHGRILYKTQTPLDEDNKPLKQSSKSIVGYLESLQLTYNPNHELDKSIKIEQKGLDVCITTTTYHYDAFGRRITKRSTTQNQSKRTQTNRVLPYQQTVQYAKNQQQTILMLWDGNRQIQEYTDSHVFTTVYEQNSFAPVARLVWLREHLINEQASEQDKEWLTKFNDKERETRVNLREIPNFYDDYAKKDKIDDIIGIKVYHYHNDQLGTPNELTNAKGEVVWAVDFEAWGGAFKEKYETQTIGTIEVDSTQLQPIRFQGQFYDSETGLHYNRFRYYDNDVGMFVSRDPIGLMGGNNVFAYAPNPTGWIDPLGLHSKEAFERMDDYYNERLGKHDACINYHRTGLEKLLNRRIPVSPNNAIKTLVGSNTPELREQMAMDGLASNPLKSVGGYTVGQTNNLNGLGEYIQSNYSFNNTHSMNDEYDVYGVSMADGYHTLTIAYTEYYPWYKNDFLGIPLCQDSCHP